MIAQGCAGEREMRKRALVWGALALVALVLMPWYMEPVDGRAVGFWLTRLVDPMQSALALVTPMASLRWL